VCVHWQFWIEQEKSEKANFEARMQFEIQRRLQPQNEGHFDILCDELIT